MSHIEIIFYIFFLGNGQVAAADPWPEEIAQDLQPQMLVNKINAILHRVKKKEYLVILE